MLHIHIPNILPGQTWNTFLKSQGYKWLTNKHSDEKNAFQYLLFQETRWITNALTV